MPSNPRTLVQISTHAVQVAVVDGNRVAAWREFLTDDASLVAAFLAEHGAPAQTELALLSTHAAIAAVAKPEETTELRTGASLIEWAASWAGEGARISACDVATGRPAAGDDAAGWLLTGMSAEAMNAAGQRLAALGLSAAATAPGLVAELGAVTELVRGTPAVVAVWEPGESGGRVWLVSEAGVLGARETAAGFSEIFEAVQTELGLKFRTAAAKLFFNGNYEFGEAAGRIAGRVAPALKAALEGVTPSAFHVAGLPIAQSWFARAAATALELPSWTPDAAAVGGRYGETPARAFGMLQAATVRPGGTWVPAWMTPDAVVPAKRVAPAPVVKPAAVAPAAPVAAKAAKPAAAPVAAPAQKKMAVAPAAKPKEPAKPVAAKSEKKFPLVPVIGGAVAVLLLAGGAMFFLKSKPAPVAETKPAASSVPAVSAPQPAPAPAAAVLSAADKALLEAELKRDPSGYKGDNYQFTVSNKGVLVNLQAKGRTTPWVRNLGFVRLYGITTQADGKRAARRAGDMNSPEYTARVAKAVRDGTIVFDVEVTHPKFRMRQSFVCLPRSVKVEVRFLPLTLTDAQGPLDALYGVHFETVDFISPTTAPVMRAGEVAYGTKYGPLVLRYDPAFKGAGEKPVVGDPALTSFVMASAGGTKEQLLSYEIVMP